MLDQKILKFADRAIEEKNASIVMNKYKKELDELGFVEKFSTQQLIATVVLLVNSGYKITKE